MTTENVGNVIPVIAFYPIKNEIGKYMGAMTEDGSFISTAAIWLSYGVYTQKNKVMLGVEFKEKLEEKYTEIFPEEIELVNDGDLGNGLLIVGNSLLRTVICRHKTGIEPSLSVKARGKLVSLWQVLIPEKNEISVFAYLYFDSSADESEIIQKTIEFRDRAMLMQKKSLLGRVNTTLQKRISF